MSAFPTQVFADPVAANCWAFEQKRIAAHYHLTLSDLGNELVLRVPVGNFMGQSDELTIAVDPIETLGDRMDRMLTDARALWSWHLDIQRPFSMGYRRCLVAMT